MTLLANYSWHPADIDVLRMNVLGRCSGSSRDTLNKTFKVLWYYGMLFHTLTAGGVGDSPKFVLDPADEGEQTALVGFDVLVVLALEWWDRDSDEPY